MPMNIYGKITNTIDGASFVGKDLVYPLFDLMDILEFTLSHSLVPVI